MSSISSFSNQSTAENRIDAKWTNSEYITEHFYDEMFEKNSIPRPKCQALFNRLQQLSTVELARRQEAADRSMLRMGITFNVYGEGEGTERIIPFDIVPRIIEHNEWTRIERGLKQRILALNMFIDDIYHRQKIIKDKSHTRTRDYVGEFVSPAVRWAQSSQKNLVPYYGHRPGP